MRAGAHDYVLKDKLARLTPALERELRECKDKAEHVDHEDFASREVAHASIADYIESFYDAARRHSSIGYVSPIEFELRSQVAAFAA
jgi:transposase InsO family protein